MEYAAAAGQRASDVAQLESATHWMRIVVEQSRKLGAPAAEHAARVVEYLELGWAYENYQTRAERIDEALGMLAALPHRTDSDRRVEANLRQWQAYAWYESSQNAEAARDSTRAGLAVLEGVGPCEERAALLHRLGWVGWRAGPAAEAPAHLEAALAEARAVGSPKYERWALHDLGLALHWTGAKAEGLRLLEQSMELAQEANDRTLLMRCYVNLPSVVPGDEGFERAVPIWEEGLARARRSMDRHSIFWIGNNLSEALHVTGRLKDAAALGDEVIAAARAMGLGMGHGGLEQMCWTLVLMGRLEEAREIWRKIQAHEPEPQSLSWRASLGAALGWADDRSASVDLMVTAAGRSELWHTTLGLLARMALRTERLDALQVAAGSLADQATGLSDSSPAARYSRYVSAMLEPDRAKAARLVAAVAAEFETIGHRLAAADAYADAAWLAQRADTAAHEWAGRATALYAACSAVPLLEPLQAAIAPWPAI